MALQDSLDEFQKLLLITPQLSERIQLTFDSAMTEVLAEMVQANMTFKVRDIWAEKEREELIGSRVIWIRIGSWTRCGASM